MLFATPTHFSVEYDINPYMHPGVDQSRASEQWRGLVEVYDELADTAILDVESVWDDLSTERSRATPPEELPDMTFCSNHALPLPGEERFVLAQMATEKREDEVRYFEQWAESAGYDVETLRTDAAFEGAGDARWHPGRELLWGGHGQRSEVGAYEELADRFDIPVIPLELTDEAYYHLDVCFSAIDDETAVVCPDAFTESGRNKLDAVFETLIEVSAETTKQEFACNCHSFCGDVVVIEATNTETIAALESHGYETVGVPTDEFMKAGGSVACMAFPH